MTTLPIHDHVEQIQQLIHNNQVIIVAGETGSGKSTQLPQICYHMGLAEKGAIAHTQPRRLAARTVAARVAEEMKSELGALVGYRMRFHEKTSANTKIQLMTDGLLLAELEHDHSLSKYSVIIIDEAHERSLNIDFLLGYLKRLLAKRPDLKVIITSATIDHERFSQHFNNAPIVEIEGRTFPVETRYMPLMDDEGEVTELRAGILKAVKTLSKQGHGDVLVFLSTEREIFEIAAFLQKASLFNVDVLPLFSRLPMAKQNAIFAKSTKRKIILATNVAETSITVPGIVFVIDAGKARLKRYNYRSKVERLPIEAISKASANQRKGRCGRVAPGICLRLYSEDDFNARPDFTQPEIHRSNLASVILKMKVLGLGEIQEFPFVEPPEETFIKDGFRLLHEIGALNDFHQLTKTGRQIAKLPLDPRLARMVIEGKAKGDLDSIIRIVSFLSVSDIRLRPLGSHGKADEAHVPFRHKTSDFLSIIKMYWMIQNETADATNRERKSYFEKRFLSYMRYREWQDIDRQLRDSCERFFKWKVAVKPLNPEKLDKHAATIHQSILPGVLSHLGLQDDEGQYLGARGLKFHLFPGSPVAKKPPKWVMCYEIVETGRVYARTAAKLDPTWVEAAAGHLLKRHYFEPFWRDEGYVGGYEKLTLYGLDVIAKRPVNYGPLDPKTSREIFIMHALVLGQVKQSLPFVESNNAMLEELEEFEHQQRSSGLIVDEKARWKFFDALVPADIYTWVDFKQWFKTADQAAFLYTREFLLNESGLTEDLYPESCVMGDVTLKLTYHFEPGTQDDGVSLNIPLALLNQVQADTCSWLVRPLLAEKIEALIRTLPKSIRRMCAPAQHFAQAVFECFLQERPMSDLCSAIAIELSQMTGAKISADDFDEAALDAHLRMNFKLLDADGELISQTRDLAELQGGHEHHAESATCDMHDDFERDGVTDWDFGDLPQKLSIEKGDTAYVAYPTLIDQGDSVQIRAKSAKSDAQVTMLDGVLRLFRLQCVKEERYLRKQLPRINDLVLLTKPLGMNFMDEFVAAVFARVFAVKKLFYAQSTFVDRLAQRDQLSIVGTELLKRLLDIFKTYQDIRVMLKQKGIARLSSEAYADIESQLECLIYEGFIRHTPDQWLKRYPVYLKAILLRVDKILSNPLKDQQLQAEVSGVWDRYMSDESLSLNSEVHYWIEEFRISTFAQQLKTAGPVSQKRLKGMF